MEQETKSAYTPAEVSKLFGISRTQQWKLRRRGELIACKLGRSVLIRRAELERLLELAVEAV